MRALVNLFGPNEISAGELADLGNALQGWRAANGRRFAYGPNFFPEHQVSKALRVALWSGHDLRTIGDAPIRSLARQRTQAWNFFNIINPKRPLEQRTIDASMPEVLHFLTRFSAQAEIWRSDRFRSGGTDEEHQRYYFTILSKMLSVLMLKGFPDYIDHSQQVAAGVASGCRELGSSPLGELLGMIVGACHDPKLEGALDIFGKNLITHPGAAAAMLKCVFDDPEVVQSTMVLFRGDEEDARHFMRGGISALAINDDSPFVTEMKMGPDVHQNLCVKHPKWLADEAFDYMRAGLTAASTGKKRPEMPEHLLGPLANILVDSGLVSITEHAMKQALDMAGVQGDLEEIFVSILDGKPAMSQTQLEDFKEAINKKIPDPLLSAKVRALTLYHGQDDVFYTGQRPARALGAFDQILLDPDKIMAVYDKEEMHLRIASFLSSYGKNINNLYPLFQRVGRLFQRAKYCGMIAANDILTGSDNLRRFYEQHRATKLDDDIRDAEAIAGNPANMGKYADAKGRLENNREVKHMIDVYRVCRMAVTDQYRVAIREGVDLLRFELNLQSVHDELSKQS